MHGGKLSGQRWPASGSAASQDAMSAVPDVSQKRPRFDREYY